jgi:hypothetical protein
MNTKKPNIKVHSQERPVSTVLPVALSLNTAIVILTLIFAHGLPNAELHERADGDHA